MMFDLTAFRARRLGQMDGLRDLILPAIEGALAGRAPDVDTILEAGVTAYALAWDELGLRGQPRTVEFLRDIEQAVFRTTSESSPERIATWLATAALGAAEHYGNQPDVTKTWITMLDEDVRDLHVPHHGETIGMQDSFNIGGSFLLYPGQPVGPPEGWINCRCTLAAGLDNEQVASLSFQQAPTLDVDEDEEEDDDDEPPVPDELLDMDGEDIPWHGLMAVEGVPAGDNRSFAEGALTWRDLPLPLTWQKVSAPEHGGSVIVGRIDRIERRGNEVWGEGVWADVPEAEEAFGLAAGQFLRGLSVEVDDVAVELGERPDGSVITMPPQTYTKARITGVTLVQTPAFTSTQIYFGALPGDDDDVDPHIVIEEEQDERAKKRYEATGEWSNETISVEDDFARGRGWITNPEETRRIHAYWTRGKGRAKIRWGTNGDFTRCTRQLRKYISPAYLNRTCAQWHHDALGYWPGEKGKPGNPPKENSMDPAAFTVVAAAPPGRFKREWFDDPKLTGPTPPHWGDDGRCFGHLATFGECHIGFADQCVTAPRSATNYAYFHTGSVVTDDGGELAVGRITFNTGHASTDLPARPAAAHYDDTGAMAALVRVGEDEFGIWFAGGMCELDERQLATLRASGRLSGDWRRIGSNLELVAALAVNVPGFPIPRPSLAASAGMVTTLVAANVVNPDPVLSVADAVIAALDARDARRARLAKIGGYMASERAERVERILASVD